MIACGILICRQQRLLSYCILWFFGNLVIESSVLRLEIVFEHRNYLPSTFVMLGLVATTFRYLRLRAAIVSLTVVAAVAALWTFERNAVWQNAVALWQDCAAKSPRKARPFNNLGSALTDQGRIEEAIVQFYKAIELKPDYGDAHYNLGYALARAGKLQEAVRHLTTAVRLEPENYMAHNNLGIALLLQDELNEAIYHFKEALRLKPNFAIALNNLGIALKHQGNYAEAINHFTEALRINPNYTEARRNLDLTIEESNAAESGSRTDHRP
jgi:tetratricopeptide (TPR) repeat protein